jgi:PKD repeat protein
MLVLHCSFCVQSQPNASFVVKSQLCLSENLQLQNTSANASAYAWDFCPRDIYSFQSSNILATLNGLSSGTDYALVSDDSNWYAFVTSYDLNKLYRLDFGADLSSTPAVIDLGNLNNQIVEPYAIDVVEFNGQWYGFVGSLKNMQGIVRLDFGSMLTTTPAATNIGSLGYSTNFVDLEVVVQDGEAILAGVANGVVNSGDASFITANFGNAITSQPPANNVKALTILAGSNTLRGFDLLEINGSWRGLFTSTTGSRLISVDFGSDIQSATAGFQTHNFSGVSLPFDVQLWQEGKHYYAVICNLSAGISLIEFNDFQSAPLVLDNTGLPNVFSAATVRRDGKTFLFAASLDNKVRRIVFETECDAAPAYSDEENPVVRFGNAGVHSIELRSSDGNSHAVFAAETLVKNEPAPELAIDNVWSVCASTPISFKGISNESNLQLAWEFGDGTSSGEVEPSHSFEQPGSYTVSLSAINNQGCGNLARKSITLYNPPIAAFEEKLAVVCTGAPVAFNNQTVGNYGSLIEYAWYVNSELKTHDIDANLTFPAPGVYEVKLKAMIPGCSSEKTQILSNVMTGPQVNFLTEGFCDNEPHNSKNESVGDVASFVWRIDGAVVSDQTNFSRLLDAGTHTVQLQAIGVNGCDNSLSKSVDIYPAPSVSFKSLINTLCQGSEIPFQDQTITPAGSELAYWHWDFGDSGMSEYRHPRYTFAAPGEYLVSLSVKTNRGCKSTTIKPIKIWKQPSAEFTYSGICIGMPVEFAANEISVKSWKWVIGEKTYSVPTPSHFFRNPGNISASLSIISNEGCENRYERIIQVPIPADPTFSVFGNCVNNDATLTDHSESDDTLVSWKWTIDNNTLNGKEIKYNWQSTGDKNVRLEVTTASGCSYVGEETVTIVPAPQARFTPSQRIGVPNSNILFVNQSQSAEIFEWDFQDGTISNDVSPQHSFENNGDFTVKLTALNEQGCESVIGETISISHPKPDVNLKAINTTKNPDGLVKTTITIQNDGNTVLENVPVDIEISGGLILNEVIPGPFLPLSRLNFTLSSSVKNVSDLEFICAEAYVAGDVNLSENRICIDLQKDFRLLPVYPNPAGQYLNVEWIGQESEPVKISLLNSLGTKAFELDALSDNGFSRMVVEISQLQKGVYLLIIQSKTQKSSQHILVGD